MQMEVGIEDCLHIEFEYDRARYHLQDVVVGKIYFLLVSPNVTRFQESCSKMCIKSNHREVSHSHFGESAAQNCAPRSSTWRCACASLRETWKDNYTGNEAQTSQKPCINEGKRGSLPFRAMSLLHQSLNE
eukprot:1136240-Pelagomonas_calceolata.AAC.17